MLLLWLLFLQQTVVQCQVNNACNNFKSYFNIFFSSNCYHIPDINQNVPETVKQHIGVSETHQVTTDDGYILTLFRIPRKSPKGVILFQHGMAQDSRVWVGQYNQSIAFLFWRNNYDVWLGNNRGTHYSKGHVKLKSNEEAYWDFSYNEIGYFDLNATITYIKMVTNVEKIFYVGHSLGAISGVIYSSLRPDEAENSIKIMVLLAPVCYSQNSPSALVYFARFVRFLLDNNVDKRIKVYSFPEYNSLLLKTIRFFNTVFPFKSLYIFLGGFLGGWSTDEFDPNYINIAVGQSGSGTSLKLYAHGYQQTLPNVTFQMYDYGKENNLKKYGSEIPPPYPLENIRVPLFTIYGENDILSSKENIDPFYQRLRPEANFGRKEVPNFNHIDFLWGRHRNEAVYNEVVRIFNEASGKDTMNMCLKTLPN